MHYKKDLGYKSNHYRNFGNKTLKFLGHILRRYKKYSLYGNPNTENETAHDNSGQLRI